MDRKDIPFNFDGRLQRFFYHAAVLPSMECGLIPGQHLTVSGDGTAVHAHASPRGHHRDSAPESLRHFPAPDASWGWDSGLEKYYFGYTLFQLSCYNAELRTDIPLLLRLTSARRHDSVNFLVAFYELEKHMLTVSIENMCLDSAMDNYPTYQFLKNRWIRAFTDLNDKCGRPKTIPDTITIDKDGTPLCQEKLRMKPNDYDRFYNQRTATERINNLKPCTLLFFMLSELLKRKSYRSIEELEASILRFIELYNLTTKPFKWTYKGIPLTV